MKINRFCAFAVAIAFAIILTGCHHTNVVNKDDKQQPPTKTVPSPSATLTVKPDTIDRGQQVELSWNTQNASSVSIDGVGTVTASGSRKLTPASSTTYRLSASGDGGSTEASARVTVNIPTDTTSQLTKKDLFEKNVKDIFFSYDNFDIRPEEAQAANADADFLAKHPDMTFLIEGHCDERGSDVY